MEKERVISVPTTGVSDFESLVKDETKKWKKLCDMLNYYAETSGCIQYSDLTLIPEEGNGEIGFKDGELVTRDILDDEPVEPDPYAAVEYYEQPDEEETEEAEGDTDGDQLVTDEPIVSGYVDIQEDVSDEDAEARTQNMTNNGKEE